MSPDLDQSPGQTWADETEFHLPEDHWPLPELVHTGKPHAEPTTSDFVAVSRTPEYQRLSATFRGFAFPMTIAGLVSYFTYVLLSIYAPAFMATPLFGAVTVGIALGLFQFGVVYAWTFFYVRFMSNRIDPTSTSLKVKLEKGMAA